jgi:hypothetical protein
MKSSLKHSMISSTSVNAVPTSGLNAENIRDEGIDRRNLATDCVQDVKSSSVYYYLSSFDHKVTGQNTSWQLIESSGTPISVGRAGPINCNSNEWIMVNCSFSFRAESGIIPATHMKGGQEVHFKLQWKDSVSGAVNDIGGTERRFNTFMVMNGGLHSNLRYSCTIVGAFRPSTTSEITIDLLGRDRRSNDPLIEGLCFVEEVTMFARVIKR